MGGMFCDFNFLKTLDASNWDTGNVVDMYCMFIDCNVLTTLDLSNWNTSKATNMSWMFMYCKSLTSLDISKWDTSNVSDMTSMFCKCYKLTTIKGIIDMKSCTSYDCMFKGCTNLTGVKIKNPPADFEIKCGLRKDQYEIVD